MKAKFGIDSIELSEHYLAALREVLKAEVEMMRALEPDFADCWHWGRAHIGDMAESRSVAFRYGAEQDMPDDGLGRFAVIVEDV